MSTPYPPPESGTQTLFPQYGLTLGYSDDEISKAASALYFDDVARWPETDGDDNPVPLEVDHTINPDARQVANWLAATHKVWLDGYTVPVPDVAAFEEHGGTVPYINPSGTDNPDAIYALNYLTDNL